MAEFNPLVDHRPDWAPEKKWGFFHAPLSDPNRIPTRGDLYHMVEHPELYNSNNELIPTDYIERKLKKNADDSLRHATANRNVIFVDDWHGENARLRLKEAFEEELLPRAERVIMEQALSDYIFDLVDAHPEEVKLKSLAYSLKFCHHTGCAGVAADGRRMVAWDHKCEQVRVCPHESREDTQRLAEHYQPGIIEELEKNPRLNAYYVVTTNYNYRRGDLMRGKREMFEKTKAWMNHNAPACPLRLNPNTGRWYKTKPFNMADCVKGSFVVQEDPMSADFEWNVHNNLILLVEGQFDYAIARAHWGMNIHFQKIDRTDPEKLTKAILEVVKYSTKPIPTEEDKKKKKAGEAVAPAMTEWPHDAWMEWWRAGKVSRRVRSYGCLYAIDRKRWDAAGNQVRYDQWLQPARLRGHDVPLERINGPWCDLADDEKRWIKESMRKPQIFNMDDFLWCGQVYYSGPVHGYYADFSIPHLNKEVTLIPGDNFFSVLGKTDNFSNGPPGQIYH